MKLYAQAVSVYCDCRIKTSSAIHSLKNVLSIPFTKVAIEGILFKHKGINQKEKIRDHKTGKPV